MAMRARPMAGTGVSGARRSTAGTQAVMHGVSVHIRQGCTVGSIMGVPAAARRRSGARRIAWCGQARIQSPQRVHPARKLASATAPGGRRTGKAGRGRAGAVVAAAWRRNPPVKKARRLSTRASSACAACAWTDRLRRLANQLMPALSAGAAPGRCRLGRWSRRGCRLRLRLGRRTRRCRSRRRQLHRHPAWGWPGRWGRRPA